jgi:metal-sulfur cluster biosynthetic enzyme
MIMGKEVEVKSLETKVMQALTEVIDPETGLSIMRMDLIHGTEVTTEGAVSLVFRPSSPICPMAYSLANSIKEKVEAVKGVASVKIRVENFERAAHLESLLRTTVRTTGSNIRRKVD